MSKLSNRELTTQGLVLVFSLIAGGILAMLLGRDLSFDVANYHYYLPFAFFHHRQSIDFWPTTYLHLFLNPTIDFIPYFLINHVTPQQMEFILGALHGLNFWLLFFIARLFINQPQRRACDLLAFFIALLGMYGPNVFPGLGSVSNDNLVSIYVLGFVLLQMISLRQYSQSGRWPFAALICSGMLLGVAVGLKLTTNIYVLGAIAACALLPVSLRDRTKLLLILMMSAAAGIMLSSGYWMLQMWQQHHNPVFPFLNNIFHSPDYASVNWRDIRFMPQGIKQWLFYPFYFSWDASVTGDKFRDFRFMFVYALLVCTAACALYRYIFHRKQAPFLSLSVNWMMWFFICSYVVWQCYISYGRYLAPLEMLAPLMIYLLLKSLFKRHYYAEALFIYFGLLLIVYMYPVQLIRMPKYEATTYFNVNFPALVKDTPEALVLTPYPLFLANESYINHHPRPQTYLIPLLPAQWRYIGVPIWNGNYATDEATHENIKTRIQHYQQKIFLLTPEPFMHELYAIAQSFGLEPDGQCAQITSDRQKVTYEYLFICPVKLSS